MSNPSVMRAKSHADFKPRQLIKCVWGLRGAESNFGLTVIDSDSTLMDMDAPECLPAGSHYSCQPLFDTDPGYAYPRETITFRTTTLWGGK